MDRSDAFYAIRDAGGKRWSRWLLGTKVLVAQVAVAIAVALPFSVWINQVGKLWSSRTGSQLVGAVVVIAGLLSMLGIIVRAILGLLPERTSIRLLLRSAKTLEAAAADGAGDGQIARGSTTSAPAETAPVMRRGGDGKWPMRVVPPCVGLSAQPFVVEGRGGPWLIDTGYIELFDKTPSKDGRAAVVGELVVDVGEEVVMLAESQDEVQAPNWFSGAVRLSGYRDRRIRRLEGTEKNPIRIWRVPKSA